MGRRETGRLDAGVTRRSGEVMSRHPIIILEGVDGSGKTTLAKALCKHLGGKYLHLTYRFKDRMHLYHTAAIWQCLRYAKHQPVILDRWWPSEKVYADVYRGGTPWPMLGRMLDQVALKHHMTYVFCLPKDRQTYLSHYEKLKARRTEMYDEGLNRVYDGFVNLQSTFFHPDRLDVFDYDFMTDGQNMGKTCQYLLEQTEDYRTSQPSLMMHTNFMNFSGSMYQGDLLFVGEKLNPKTHRETWPFMEYANSSLWLHETLDELKIPSSKIMFTNALDPGFLTVLLRVSNKTKVIPLGVAAADNVRAYNPGLEVLGGLNHPAWYKRFNAKKGINDFYRVLAQV